MDAIHLNKYRIRLFIHISSRTLVKINLTIKVPV